MSNEFDSLPAKYRPLSPWAYWGLTILFSVPVVGFIFLIIFSISGANINRRNFARSYFCTIILVCIIFFIIYIIMIATGSLAGLGAALSSLAGN